MCVICTLCAPNVRNPHVLFRPFFDKIKARQEKEGRFNTVSWLACGGVSWRFPAGALALASEKATFSAGTVFACRVVSGTKLSGGAGYRRRKTQYHRSSGGRHYAESLARGRVFHCAGIRRAGRVPRGYRRRSLKGGRETNANYH